MEDNSNNRVRNYFNEIFSPILVDFMDLTTLLYMSVMLTKHLVSISLEWDSVPMLIR